VEAENAQVGGGISISHKFLFCLIQV